MDILNRLILGELKVSQALFYLITSYSSELDEEFLAWAKYESNGYSSLEDLPDYRYVECEVYAKYHDNFGNEHKEQIDVKAIDDFLSQNGSEKALVSKMRFYQGLESLENAIADNKGGSLIMPFPKEMNEMIGLWFHTPADYHNLSIYQCCHLEQGANIMSVVKSRIIEKLTEIEPKDKNYDKTQEKSSGPLIFISHASKDKLVIKSFVDNILKNGLGLKDENIVFTSYEATGVVPGDSIPDYIKRNIEGANMVLAMVSKNYKASEVCMNEVGASWALGKTPVQIMLPNTKIDKLGWLIHLDKAARIEDRDSLDSLEEVICNALSLSIPTAKHWNPCTRAFLETLKNIPDLYNEDEPECSIFNSEGSSEILCAPQYKRISYYKRKEDVRQNQVQKDLGTTAGLKGFTPSVLESWQNTIAQIQPVTAKAIRKETNKSFVRIQLWLKNNSKIPIGNGKLIIWSSEDGVVFAGTNMKNHGIIANVSHRIHQTICRNAVEESFPRPINPTATEKLYDFYISAPHNIDSFQLLWKLESLNEPKTGTINVLWSPKYEEEYVGLNEENDKIGTMVIEDMIITEYAET